MYVLDTNIIIYYLDGESKIVSLVKKIFQAGLPVYISTITETELFSFPDLNEQKAQDIDAFLNLALIASVDSQIARQAGQIRRKYHLKLADSLIAATAVKFNSILLTRNIKDFKRILSLKLQKI